MEEQKPLFKAPYDIKDVSALFAIVAFVLIIAAIVGNNLFGLFQQNINFAYLLSHEMIHIAQSCRGGSFDSYPLLLGLELKKSKSYYYKYLNNDIYKDLKKDDIMLEIEAYANQADISRSINAFKYFCLQRNNISL